MQIKIWLNGKEIKDHVNPDTTLLEFVRSRGCYSVKCGCETSNCGLCTLWVEGKALLSCSIPALRVNGKHITTLEGLQEDAEEFGGFLADEGADQCGFCNPGFIMNVLSLVRELEDPTEEEIREYLAGNLCRCTGYMGQQRAVRNYLAFKKEERQHAECK